MRLVKGVGIISTNGPLPLIYRFKKRGGRVYLYRPDGRYAADREVIWRTLPAITRFPGFESPYCACSIRKQRNHIPLR